MVQMTPENVRAVLAKAIQGAGIALQEDGADEGLAKLWLYYRSQAHDTTTAMLAAALIELAQIKAGEG